MGCSDRVLERVQCCRDGQSVNIYIGLVATSVDMRATVRLSQGWRRSAVLARHTERGDDNVQQHDDVDEVRDYILPRGDAHEQRRVSVTVSQLG